MSEIYIDVGPHKSASTYRQNVIYPKLEARNYIHCFANGGSTHLDFNIKRKIIISDESLSGWSYLPNHDAHKERLNSLNNLRKWFPDANIIVCKRKKESWKKSLWKQYVWAGGKLKYNQWKKEMNDSVFEIEDYITDLKNNFEKVLVLDFEELINNHQKYCEKICSFVGVETPKIENKRLNKSLSFKKTDQLRKFNKLWWTHESKGIPGFRYWREFLYLITEKDKTLVK